MGGTLRDGPRVNAVQHPACPVHAVTAPAVGRVTTRHPGTVLELSVAGRSALPSSLTDQEVMTSEQGDPSRGLGPASWLRGACQG